MFLGGKQGPFVDNQQERFGVFIVDFLNIYRHYVTFSVEGTKLVIVHSSSYNIVNRISPRIRRQKFLSIQEASVVKGLLCFAIIHRL